MRLELAIAVACALAAAGADAAAPGAEAFAESVVALQLNGQPAPVTLVVRRDRDGALLVKAADLAALRLRTPSHGVVLVNGERYYRIGAGPGSTMNFDDAAQTVELTLPPSAFVGTRALATSPDAAARPARTGVGGFLNYELTAQQVSGQRSSGALVEAGAYSGLGVVTSTLLGRDEPDRRGVVRLDTTWTRDFPAQLATLRVGDAISSTGAWGRAVRFGGVQFGTNFATQPTLVTTPFLAASGEAVVPSTVDVFINGQRAASQDVAPGPFAIENLPAISGSGQMQVVVTDALGRQQVISQPFYSGASLLRKGLEEYSAELGTVRRAYAVRSNDYGAAVAAGTYRRGITNLLTAEVHGEAEAGGAHALGVDAALQAGDAGVLSATLAAGGDRWGSGTLVGFGFERSGRRLSLFARSQLASEGFAQLGTEALASRPRQRTYGGVGLDLGSMGGVQLAYGEQSFWNAGPVRTLGLSYSRSLGAYGFLSVFASHSRAGTGGGTDLLLSWTMSLGDRRTVTSQMNYGPGIDGRDELQAAATLQQSLPPGSGSGYLVSAASSREYQLDYTLQGGAGRVAVDYARRNDEDGVRLDATGGVAITGAGVMPSRWLDRSFAVVQVDDYPGVTVYVENQPVGHTDDKGRVLLPDLRAYESNRISIDPLQLPMDASLATASMTVTPAFRSGPLVRFPVHRSRAATMTLELPDGTPVPAGAQVALGDQRYPVALNGLLYVADAGDARSATAEWVGDHRCSFTIDLGHAGHDPQPDLGVVTCRPVGGT